MTEPAFNRAPHFSIVWAFVLAVLTMVEWRSLDRDPLNEQVYLPFIERVITVSRADPGEQGAPSEGKDLQTNVQIDFNGPLFLVYFAGPIVIFHALGLLIIRLRGAE